MSFAPKVEQVGPLKVILVKDDRESVMVQALVGTGSREETDDLAGSAHFLEHFVFKGTKKYPVEIGAYVDGFGGAIDAYTSHESISFSVKLTSEKLKTAVDLVGQLVGEPLLPAKLISREKKIICEEIKFRNDDPHTRAYRGMWEQMYRGSNLGRPIAGSFATVEAVTAARLHDHMERWFVPENTIIGVLGNWKSETEVLKLISRSFGTLIERGKTKLIKDKYVPVEQKKPRIELVSRKSMAQTTVFMGYRSFGVGQPQMMARILSNIILGGGWISRLLQEIREKRGLAYGINSSLDVMSDTGAVVIGAGLPKDKLEEAVKLIWEIIYGLSGSGKWGLKKKDVELAKDCYLGRLSLKYDSPERVLDTALYDLMYEGKIYSVEELKKMAKETSLSQMKRVCGEIFVPDHLNMAVVGDYDKLPFKL
ncbi:insulinase family protein [Candidatus Collierbacteria bacterium]|nr:insulinase family protein [Candidatus Collierbacteria bacterium]